MKYYNGIDYFLYFMDFPHMGVPGVIVANSDGTANIYINTLYCEEKQRQTIKHELRHLAKNHFYCDWMTIEEKEAEADDIHDQSVSYAEDFSFVDVLEAPKEKSKPVEVRVLPGSNSVFSIFRSNSLPENVSFGFYVPGNAMMPLFKKDTLLYCDDQQLKPGDIGMFLYQGETICRQYNKDIFGFTYLFSLDRKNNRSDIVLQPNEESKLKCLGRIITEKRYPLPHER